MRLNKLNSYQYIFNKSGVYTQMGPKIGCIFCLLVDGG